MTRLRKKVDAAFRHSKGAAVELSLSNTTYNFATPEEVMACTVVNSGTLEHAVDRYNGRHKTRVLLRLAGVNVSLAQSW